MMELLLRWWCRRFHNQLFRPAHGQYRCAVCLRTWPVRWLEVPAAVNRALPPARSTARRQPMPGN